MYDFVKADISCLLARPIQSTEYGKKGEKKRVRDMVGYLPLVLSTRFMEDILLAVDSKDTVFHDALPIYPAMSVLLLPNHRENIRERGGHTTCF
jgi:hypothetical protein